MPISDRLKVRRQELGLTQEQVAHLAEMNVTQYNGYERGRSTPAFDTMLRISKALKSEPESFNEPRTVDFSPSGDRGSALRELKEHFQSQVASLLGVGSQDICVRIEIL